MCLALALLLFSGCGGQKAQDSPPPEGLPPVGQPKEAPPPETAPPAPPGAPQLPELEETDWQIVSTDAEAFGLTGSFDNPNFEYVFNHTDTVPLDQLIAFALVADGASEGADCELRDRFVEAPHAVLAYLALMGDQIAELGGWEPMPTAEIVCGFIASTDAAFYDDHEPFNATLAACREAYPGGRIAGLLDVLEREHAASMERHQ